MGETLLDDAWLTVSFGERYRAVMKELEVVLDALDLALRLNGK